MKPSICHYSYRKLWESNSWNCTDLARKVRSLGAGAVDFHVRFLDPATAVSDITEALSVTGLELSGISLSDNLNKVDADEFEREIEATVNWIQLASEVEAPVSRIFGGHIEDRSNPTLLDEGFSRILDGLGRLASEAEKYGVVLALENHGGLPCTAEEQIDVIRKINSLHLRATVDIGNYMSCGQESTSAVAIAAPYASYVHVKDFRKKKSGKTPWGWEIESAILGRGDVDVAGCLAALHAAQYEGYVALEYEAAADEEMGVAESIDHLRFALESVSPE